MKKLSIVFIVFCMVFSFISFVRANDNMEVKVVTDKTDYLLGEPVKITYTITNNSDSPLRFTFNTSQIYDFSIVNYGQGTLVYRWSKGKTFAQVITYLEIPAYSNKEFTAVWNQKNNAGKAVTVGGYKVSFWLIPEEIPGRVKETVYLASTAVEISSTVNIPFQDIANPTVRHSVKFLYEKGLIKGYPDGTFKPERNLTRAESAVLILRVMGITLKEDYRRDFVDVPMDFWGFKWIEEAFTKGIVKGTGQGKFSPNSEITRGEFVTMLVRAL
ncbi:MAG: S-layer homology domain-containing protein, partial [Caldisericota bacterium]|nr:S-layer homology domain-containing protein [Caldisericota bacterium]